VMHTATPPLQSAAIAFAGPLVHLVFWTCAALMGRKQGISRKFKYTLALVSRINMFLFIFNMLPIPGFDGFQVYSGIVGGLISR
jgi:Zn-dependent protease